MKFQYRLIVFMTVLVVVIGGSTAAALGIITRKALLDETKANAASLAEGLANVARFTIGVPDQIDRIVSDQMVSQAVLTAHLVSVAKKGGYSDDQISAELQQVAANTNIKEFWISDASGKVVIKNLPVDFAFTNDPSQGQAYSFYPLINQQNGKVVQKAIPRNLDKKIYKYVGASGIDSPRIVQVGYEATYLNDMSTSINVQAMIDLLAMKRGVQAILISDPTGRALAFASDRNLTQEYVADAGWARTVAEVMSSNQTITQDIGNSIRVVTPYQASDGKVAGVISLLMSTETVTEAIQRIFGMAAALTLGCILIGILLAYLVSKGVTRPLALITNIAKSISAGNLDLQAEVNSSDEIGILAGAFNQMTVRLKQTLAAERAQHEYQQNKVKEYSDFMNKVGQGNLMIRLEVKDDRHGPDGSAEELAEHINEATAQLEMMFNQIRQTANQLNATSAEILAATTQQVTGASEQSSAISQVTTTVEEVKALAEQSVLRAQEVVEASNRTVEVSRSGMQTVHETIDSMTLIKEHVEGVAEHILALAKQTQQIGEIIMTVSDIAAQSNLLALNASVEAARAGEHGKSFAVVASEVRSLAEQSRQATVQVKSILQSIQKATNTTVMVTEESTKVVERGVHLAAQTQLAIEQLSSVIDESAQKAAQVKAGGQQQAAGMEQISFAMQNIHQAMLQSLTSTRQAEKAAQDLNTLAHTLNDRLKNRMLDSQSE
jgi:methyl-accepting chemotaxis protein